MKKSVLFLLAFLFLAESAAGIPLFARRHNLTCASCHTFPPHLNEFGLDFVERGYQLEMAPAHRPVPLSLWATQRFEHNDRNNFTKSFPNRVELISGGPIGSKVSYFVEWRVLSLQTTSPDGVLRDRSGRFEDLFFNLGFTPRFSMTVGQFRMLSQWDASRKLSLSTPVVFSAGVAGEPATSPRITSLRSFSLQSRALSIRVIATRPGDSPSRGWFHEFTVPFAGEFSAPLTSNARVHASFELEGRPKGLFYETYYRRSGATWGGGLYVGDDRWMGTLIGQQQFGDHHLYGGLGTARHRSELQDFRLSLGHQWIPRRWFAVGSRIDHLSADRRSVAFVPHVNFHFPGSKYTIMLVMEPFIQKDNHRFNAELSVVF